MQKTVDNVTYVLDKDGHKCSECAANGDVALCDKLGYDCIEEPNSEKVWRIIEEKQYDTVA